MRRYVHSGRRLLGAALALAGVLLVFVCLPIQALLIVLGLTLAAAGLLILQC